MIRPARAEDLDQLLVLIKAFARESLINYTDWQEQDLARARLRLTTMILNHYLMVAEYNDKIVGAIGAIREQDPWISSRSRMREVFWWVDPAYRRSKLSAQLFLRWQADAESWLSKHMVDAVSLSTQPGSTDIDLTRRGWHCVEQHWIKD